MNVNLVMFKGDGTRRDFSLKKDRVLIGRTHACDLRIPLSAVSRKHCEVLLKGETAKLRDLGSLNGTYCNGERVLEEVKLEAGDRIVIGPVVFTLVINDEPKEIKAVGAGSGEASEARDRLSADQVDKQRVQPDSDATEAR